MNQYTMLNFVLANKKKQELEAQGITIPSDFMTKSLIYGMVAPNMPMLGYMIIDKDAKKLIADKAARDAKEKAQEKEVPATETGNPPKAEETASGTETGNPPKEEETASGTDTGNPSTLPPIIKITAVDRKGAKLNIVYFASLPGKIDQDFANVLGEKSFDTAITDEHGVTNLFYPKDGDVTIISYANDRLSKLQFDAGKVPSDLEFLIESIPEQVSPEIDKVKGSKGNTIHKK